MTAADAIALSRGTGKTVEMPWSAALLSALEAAADEGDGRTFNGADWTVVLVAPCHICGEPSRACSCGWSRRARSA